MEPTIAPKAIIGLGNPGHAYVRNRHNIGFMIVDALAQAYGIGWHKKDDIELARIAINNKPVLLLKPQTFMNSSGVVVPFLAKQGMQPEDILVIHDELEMPFGKLAIRVGGSARGHNGLRSIMSRAGEHFARLRFGIGRPERKEDVPSYVLENFKENSSDINRLIDQAITMVENLYISD
jgi:peptidyl-tRNA hydrolase, PTH1 family